jgi:hypothetical protein
MLSRSSDAVDGYQLVYGQVLLSLIDDVSPNPSILDLLTHSLVENVLVDDHKNQLKLSALARGGCISPMEIISFDKLETHQIDVAKSVVDKWLTDDNRSCLFHQAFLSGAFSEEDKIRIANLAWRNTIC